MPYSAASSDSVFAKPITPDQVATDSANPGIGWIAEIAVMLRMLPPPRAFISGTVARAIRTTYIRFCSTALLHAASSKSSAAPSVGAASLFDEHVAAAELALQGVDDARAILRTPAIGLDRHDGWSLKHDVPPDVVVDEISDFVVRGLGFGAG